MKELSDEKIQELLDAGEFDFNSPEADDTDVQLYQNLFQALESDSIEVPPKFAASIAAQVYFEQERKAAILSRIVNGLIVVGLFIVAVVALKVNNISFGFEPRDLLANDVAVFVAGIALLVAVATTVEALLKRRALNV